ncbi:MAG: GNAT family N-acetyltransferase, partial [Chloroflexota bacterium]
FVLPTWLKVWWQEFSTSAELYLGAVREGGQIIGIAPLKLSDGKASFVGSDNVCDYLDFVIVPERESDFFGVLLDDLRDKHINQLDLGLLRPDSKVLTHLVGIAQNRAYEVLRTQEDVSVEMDLPNTWEEYLAMLDGKQRHEVRRKLRKLAQAGKADYHTIKDSAAASKAMDTFLKMFSESRRDKATFLTTQMESFFRSLADAMAKIGLLRLGVLELDSIPVAMILYFDYNNCVYLYNSGYVPQYDSLSAGLLCKVLSIQASIQEGKKRFDFLKGNETYKYHLGGREVPLSRCLLNIK